ncbi:hypothetical protein LINGRAPRIM_LOCUS3376 [Linum grandiflorum]
MKGFGKINYSLVMTCLLIYESAESAYITGSRILELVHDMYMMLILVVCATRQTTASSVSEPSNDHRSNRNGDNDVVVAQGKAANRTKSSKHNSQLLSLVGVESNSAVTEIKSDSRVVQGSKTYIGQNESKEHDRGIKAHDDKNCVNPAPRRETMPDGLWVLLQESPSWFCLTVVDFNHLVFT